MSLVDPLTSPGAKRLLRVNRMSGLQAQRHNLHDCNKSPNVLTVQVYLTTTTSLERSVWINSQCVVHEVYKRPVCFTCYNSSQSHREQQQQWASININPSSRWWVWPGARHHWPLSWKKCSIVSLGLQLCAFQMNSRSLLDYLLLPGYMPHLTQYYYNFHFS